MVLWVPGMPSRHYPEKSSQSVHHASNGGEPHSDWKLYQLLKKIQDTAGIISPDQIWSGDETGVQNVPKEVKVLGVKHIRTFQQVSSEQGETSTVLSFVSAGSKVCPPLVIHKGQRVQETWCMKAPGDILLSATTKGYITKSRFHQYGEHFIKFLKHEGLANRKNLLIVDGHKSHLYNLPFYEAMRANGIEVLQPLDSIPFTQLKKTGKRIFEDIT